MTWLRPVSLQGSRASLVPLNRGHKAELIEAVQDGELWKLWYTSVPAPDKVGEIMERRLAAAENGSMLPFAIIDNTTGKAVGMTNYMHIEPDHRRLEIGGTWYRKSVQRTQVNTQCKLLLLGHVFEVLHCIAVEFRTHFFNLESRRAFERLGAKLDGVLRNHRIGAEGTLRDSCCYSIIASEWPTVKVHLAHLQRRYER